MPIIGIAKRSFINTEEVSFPIYRGESKVPLYISTIGCKIEKVLPCIENMHGNYRIPTILKYLDTLTKEK
jgi:deoxyinosine 3'endonuclease (endonuclease V)